MGFTVFPSYSNCIMFKKNLQDIIDLDISEKMNIGEMVHSEAFFYSPTVEEFILSCINNGFVLTGFDWQKWYERHKSLADRCCGIEEANIFDIAKIITVYIRNDHGCTGYLSSKIEDGSMKILASKAISLIMNMKKEATVRDALVSISNIIKELKETYSNRRQFSIDGRLVGDIGEIIAEQYYAIKLNLKQEAYYDAELESDSNAKIQIKVTMKKSLTFPKTDANIPHYYLGLVLDEYGQFEEIYNGSFSELYNILAKDDSKDIKMKGYKSISVKKLRHIYAIRDSDKRIPRRDNIYNIGNYL